ncbi:MAG: hypothetical protein ACFNOO_07755, partial [Segatella oulorum]
LKNSCSAPAERIFFSKMVVPAPRNTVRRFGQPFPECDSSGRVAFHALFGVVLGRKRFAEQNKEAFCPTNYLSYLKMILYLF